MNRTRTLLAAALAVASIAPPARGAPAAGCRAERAGDRALVTVGLVDLLDDELLRLVRLGLTGKVRIEATLRRRRRLWMDARRATERREAFIAFSRAAGGYTVDGALVADPSRFTLPPLVLRPGGALGDPRAHYVELAVEVEVVTAESLGHVARWLAGGGDEGGSRVSRSLVSLIAADLVRTVEGRCDLR